MNYKFGSDYPWNMPVMMDSILAVEVIHERVVKTYHNPKIPSAKPLKDYG